MADPRESGATCAQCGGGGYVVERMVGATARARRCGCQVSCPRCGETGYTLVRAGDSQVAQICACRHLDQRIELFNRVGIPAALATACFQNFKTWTPEQARAKEAAEDFARRFRPDQPMRGLLLHGRPGCGKTHLLAAILRYLTLEKGVAGRYAEFMLVLSDIRAGFDSRRGHMEILGPLLNVPILAIDELGKERGTEWERSMLDELISRRYNSGLTTLFATNYPIQPERIPTAPGTMVKTQGPQWQQEAETMCLAERVGQRSFSRLNEMCVFHEVRGKDYRALGIKEDASPDDPPFWR